MIAAVADTHAALWLLFGDSRLSATAGIFFEQAAAEGNRIALAPISMAEIVYLVEKNRLPPASFENLMDALKDPDHIPKEGPFTSEVAAAMRQIPREAVPDMPDGIVAATAVYLRVPGHQPRRSHSNVKRANGLVSVWPDSAAPAGYDSRIFRAYSQHFATSACGVDPSGI